MALGHAMMLGGALEKQLEAEKKYRPKHGDTISCIGLANLSGLSIVKPHAPISVAGGQWLPMFSLSRRCCGYRFNKDM